MADPYRWLEDGRSAATLAWTSAEDKNAVAALDTPARAQAVRQLQSLYHVETYFLPDREGGRLLYGRIAATEQTPRYYVRDEKGERLILDAVAAKGSIGEFVPSPDGKKVAYTLQPLHSDHAVLHVREVDTGVENSSDVIAGVDNASIRWSADSQGFYYYRLPVTGATNERAGAADIRYHVMRQPPVDDARIFPATHKASIYLTPSTDCKGRYLFISADHGWTDNAIYVKKLATPADTSFWTLFASTCATASVIDWEGYFYLLTNRGAPFEKIVRAVESPRPEWKTIVRERPGCVIESMAIIGNRLVLTTQENAENKLEIHALSGEQVRLIDLPSGSIEGISGHEDSPELFVRYESFLTAPQIYSASVDDASVRPWPASVSTVSSEANNFALDHPSYTSKDGTSVPIWILRPKNAHGPIPFLIQAYGGFDVSMVPRYNPEAVVWLTNGGGLAVPELRGGGEKGEAWHQAGSRENKQQTFDDFVASAEFLIRSGQTRKDMLAIQGGSNGGLSVAAFITQRPDLIQAAICKNPLTDMIRYTAFGEGNAWTAEYGDPSSSSDFKFLYAYSPYHHVREGTAYPSTLFLSAENDDRVDPMHARKFAAALQAATSGEGPMLFRVLANSGHQGSGQIDGAINEGADRLAFLEKELPRD